MNEHTVVAQARQGSDEAWAQIIQTYQAAVFRLCYLILANAEDAEDVTQETFVRAHRFFERFDENKPLRPWLLQIARNLARNRQRSLRRYWGALRRFVETTPPRATLPPETRTEAEARAVRLWQVVGRLKAQDQEVIYLRYFLDLSTAETAETLAVAEGTIKSRLHRALERLRVEVEATDPDLHGEWVP